MRSVPRDCQYSGAVEIRLRRSRWATALVAAAFGGSSAVVIVTPYPTALRLAIGLWLLASSLEAAARIASHAGPRGVSRIRIDLTAAVEIENRRGAIRTGVLRDGSFVAPWLTIVRWRPQGARFDCTILVLPDMLDAESFRRLRVLLKWI